MMPWRNRLPPTQDCETARWVDLVGVTRQVSNGC